MKKKPNIKIGIIMNIALTVLSIVYMFVYYIEQNGFEFNYNSLLFFIYFFIIFPLQDKYYCYQGKEYGNYIYFFINNI